MYLKKFIFTILIILIMLSGISTYAVSDDIITYSPTVILMESKTGKVIYEKNAYEKAYPASTTKIITAILALEKCKLDEVVVASDSAVNSIPAGYSNADIKVGEELTIEQLLNVLMVASANEAANIIAEHIAGSVDDFCTMMNEKAIELGCKNTNFVNPNGIQNENHYSTAYDLALMGRYAMQNEKFRELVRTKMYTLPATNKHDTDDRVFYTTNLLMRGNNTESNNYYYKYATGIKTGYTDAAQSCIVASSKKDGIEYIVVILGAGTMEDGQSARYLDCINLFDYAFDNYSMRTLNENNSVLKTIAIQNGDFKSKKLDVLVKDEISVLVKKDTNEDDIVSIIDIKENLNVPIFSNDVVGKITYNIDGIEYSSELLAGNNVIKSNSITAMIIILLFIGAIVIMCMIVTIKNRKEKKLRGSNYLYW